MSMIEDILRRPATNGQASSSQAQISFRGRRWVFPRIDEAVLKGLLAAGYGKATAHVLAARGIDAAAAEPWLKADLESMLPPDGFLNDLDAAVDRLARAVAFGEKIAIWGDYDVDGATSSAILARTLRHAGVEATIHIPDRIKEGYGPNAAGLERLRAEGHTLVAVLDSGTTAFEPLAAARKVGLDVVVVDHHAAEETLPQVEALVNPNRLDQAPGYGQLCAAGLTWLVCRRLMVALGYRAEDADAFLDIAALGTVCDVVPLKGLNRAIVRRGLEAMASTRNPGLRALIAVSQITGDPTPYHCGFLLGPRINAGGRIGESWAGATLLSSDDDRLCMRLADRLDKLNTERQQIERACLAEADAIAQTQADSPVIFVVGEGWHEGVVGIVAGRLKEAYDKPTFVFSRIEDQDGRKLAKGSARSMPDYDLGASVIAARQNGLLVKGGGHAMAAGATLDLEQADAFRAFLEAEVRRSEFARTGPTCRVDAALHPSRADLPFIASLEALEPFGQGNPRPRFLLRGCFLRNSRWLKEKHFKTTITKGGAELSAILFNARGTPLGDGIAGNLDRPLDLVVTLDINEWKDRRTPQAMIEDARPSRLTED